MKDYGAQSTVTLAAATATSVLPNRLGRRIAFSIANVGANAAYVCLSDTETAVANYGIYLAPGGILTDTSFPGIPAWNGAVNAVSTGGSTLAVWERVVL